MLNISKTPAGCRGFGTSLELSGILNSLLRNHYSQGRLLGECKAQMVVTINSRGGKSGQTSRM